MVIPKYFLGLSAIICSMLYTSCNKSERMHMKHSIPSTSSIEAQEQPATMIPSFANGGRTDSTDEQKEKKFAVVFLHGFLGQAKNLDFYKRHVAKKFKDALIIMPTNREGFKSITSSDQKHIDSTLNYIQNELSRLGKDPETFPIIFVTHSHGGKVACLIGCEATCHNKETKSKLNIWGMYLINAPLCGFPMQWKDKKLRGKIKDLASKLKLEKYIDNVPTLDNDSQEERKKIEKAMQREDVQTAIRILCAYHGPKTIEDLSKLSDIDDPSLSLAACLENPAGSKLLAFLGTGSFDTGVLEDAKPGSESTKKVWKFLREMPHDIQCRLAASYLSSVEKLCTSPLPKHLSPSEFDDELAQFITGTSTGKHDSDISLHSQLCRGNSFINLHVLGAEETFFGKEAYKRDNISAIVFQDLIHASIFPFINREVDHAKTVLGSDKITGDLLNFIQSCVEKHKLENCQNSGGN